MADVFLLSPHEPQKNLNYIKSLIMLEGHDCEILNSPIDALLKVKQCFGIKYKKIPQIRVKKAGPFKLNPEKYTLKIGHKEVKLRKKEFELFQFLISNKNQTINRTSLIENVWGHNSNPFSNTVDVHMASLRSKVNTQKNTYIRTIHGVGYYLEV